MSKQTFVECIRNDIAPGVQIAASTVEAILFPDVLFAIDDPRLYGGAALRYRAWFDVSFVVTTPGTLTFALRWGGVAGTILAQSGAYAPDPTGALANRTGKIEIDLTWRKVSSVASSSIAIAIGEVALNDVDDASVSTLQGNLAMRYFGSAGANTPAEVTGLDTTTAKALSLTAKFSVNTAGTQITGHQRSLELLT